jgi:hypothetical protein
MARGSGRGIGGTVTRPAPSRPRVDWEEEARLDRTDTEVLREEPRLVRERPDSERLVDSGPEALVDPRPVDCAGTAAAGADVEAEADAGAAGARPHSVQ